jgi:hypothetical protein
MGRLLGSVFASRPNSSPERSPSLLAVLTGLGWLEGSLITEVVRECFGDSVRSGVASLFTLLVLIRFHALACFGSGVCLPFGPGLYFYLSLCKGPRSALFQKKEKEMCVHIQTSELGRDGTQ